MAFLDGGLHFVTQGSHFFLTLHLGRGVNGFLNTIAGNFITDFQQFRLGKAKFISSLLLTANGTELFLLSQMTFTFSWATRKAAIKSSSGSSLAEPSIMMT